MVVNTNPTEAFTRTNINIRLINLGYKLNETLLECNVYQERAKTQEQKKKLNRRKPDYLIYKSGTNKPIAVIEAKKPNEKLDEALKQAIKYYAIPLGIPLVFVTNDTFVYGYHVSSKKVLKIDGYEVQDFCDEKTLLRFIDENTNNIKLSFENTVFSRETLIQSFKNVNKLLRNSGLREGYERFTAFTDLLFLKLLQKNDKFGELTLSSKMEQNKSSNVFSWSNLLEKNNDEILIYLNDTVRPRLHSKFGDIFDGSFTINNPNVIKEILSEIDLISIDNIDSDIKGDAFEFFLRSVTNGNKDLGEYYTPRHIVKTIVNLLAPRYGDKIYDPFCGTGGFLLDVFRYLSKRSDMNNSEIRRTIKGESVFGREITTTARITKMNMILFGDGHTNIERMDSLSNPVDNVYDIAVSNIPYSQETEYGGLYDIPTKNADSICVQHLWRSLKEGGKMAVIVPEPFLYEGGIMKDTRDLVLKEARDVSIVSLPRGVFNPYTPTKTSVFFATKTSRKENKAYFFVVNKDGFELGARRRPLKEESDLPKLLSSFEDRQEAPPKSIFAKKILSTSSLFPFDYMEHLPKKNKDNIYVYLRDILEEVNTKVKAEEYKDDCFFDILEISKKGISIGEELTLEEYAELSQKYKKVETGNLVYNPHRINIGSICVIPELENIMLVSPIYVVFKIKDNKIPEFYLMSLLKSDEFLSIISHYTKGGARSNLSFEDLGKIEIPIPTDNKVLEIYKEKNKNLMKYYKKIIQEQNNFLI